MRVRITASAKQDLQRARTFYDRMRPGLGNRFLDAVGNGVRDF